MRTFYITINADNETPGMKVVHRFPPLAVYHTYCCRESQLVARKLNIVVEVQAESRAKAKAQVSGAVRIRTAVPAGGWASLERHNMKFVEIC